MLQARHVALQVAGRAIVDDISLDLIPGRITVAIGPNGAGKSTLLRLMSGTLKPTAGRVLMHGRDVRRLKADELAAHRAVLGQSLSLQVPFTVDAVVRFGLPPLVDKPVADRLVGTALAELSLSGERLRPITMLSGGEQQRVHIARVLVQLRARTAGQSSPFLLLDEPTAHLDPAYQQLLARVARGVASEGGGVFAVLHDLNLAAAIADEVAVVDGGRLVSAGPPATILTARLLKQVYGIDFEVRVESRRVTIVPAY